MQHSAIDHALARICADAQTAANNAGHATAVYNLNGAGKRLLVIREYNDPKAAVYAGPFQPESPTAYYICVAQGQADFMPDSQDYHKADSIAELESIVAGYCDLFDSEYGVDGLADQSGPPYAYAFRAPHTPNVTNWSQRLRIARDSDFVLDVIGMTESEYERESV